VEENPMVFERSGPASRFIDAVRRLGEETAALVESSVDQAEQELSLVVDMVHDTVVAAAAEAEPELVAAQALGRKLGYACIGLVSLVEEELERRLSDIPAAEAVRQAYAPQPRRSRGV
jgi:hypothetical protein